MCWVIFCCENFLKSSNAELLRLIKKKQEDSNLSDELKELEELEKQIKEKKKLLKLKKNKDFEM